MLDKLRVKHASGFLLDDALSFLCILTVPVHLQVFVLANNLQADPTSHAYVVKPCREGRARLPCLPKTPEIL